MNESRIAFVSSILLHLILAAIALIIHYQIIPKSILKKIEVIEFGMLQEANNEKFVSPISQSSSTSKNKNAGKKSSLIPKKVELPHTISAADEPLYVPEYKETAFNQLDFNEQIGNTSEKGNLSDKAFAGRESVVNEESVISTNNDYLSSLTNRLMGEESSGLPYILEGEIKSRKIISRIIPKYPAGVEKTTKIKIQFDVLKSGEVTNMIILQKADPILELNSLNALGKWRFNEISQEIIQKGTITFIYELK